MSGTWLAVPVCVSATTAEARQNTATRFDEREDAEVDVDVDTKVAYRRHRVDHDAVDQQGRRR